MKNLKIIQNLVGPVTESTLRYVDYAVIKEFGIFCPAAGPCSYSITENHTHPAYMVVYNLNDAGKIQIEEKTIQTEPNRVYFFSPDVIHHEVIEDDFIRYYAYMITPQLFDASLSKLKQKPMQMTGQSSAPDPNLLHYTRDFFTEYEEQSDTSPEQLELLSRRITHVLLRSLFRTSNPVDLTYNDRSIDTAIQLMHQKFTDEISIQDLACSVQLSPSHFSRTFKKVTGLSAPDYLKNIRLEHARKMLSRTSLPVTEIAFACGFNSSSYFTTSFTGRYGTSPSQYRDSYFPYRRQNI